MELSIVVGNPKARSRTLQIAEAVARRVCGATQASLTLTVDLAEYTAEMFTWPSETMAALNKAVAATDILIVASPTYKATYTGLLKAFLDRYPNNGLSGVTAVPVMTAGTPAHAMAVEVGLRPLLVELGASVPTRGLSFLTSQMDELDEIVDIWAGENLCHPGVLGPLTRPEVIA